MALKPISKDVHKRQGWKFDGWHDVGWFEKRLGGDGAAQPVIPFPQLDAQKIQECLQTHTEMLNDGGLN